MTDCGKSISSTKGPHCSHLWSRKTFRQIFQRSGRRYSFTGSDVSGQSFLFLGDTLIVWWPSPCPTGPQRGRKRESPLLSTQLRKWTFAFHGSTVVGYSIGWWGHCWVMTVQWPLKGLVDKAIQKEQLITVLPQSSGAVWKSRWPSWAPRPNEPYGFWGRKADELMLNVLRCHLTY